MNAVCYCYCYYFSLPLSLSFPRAILFALSRDSIVRSVTRTFVYFFFDFYDFEGFVVSIRKFNPTDFFESRNVNNSGSENFVETVFHDFSGCYATGKYEG